MEVSTTIRCLQVSSASCAMKSAIVTVPWRRLKVIMPDATTTHATIAPSTDPAAIQRAERPRL